MTKSEKENIIKAKGIIIIKEYLSLIEFPVVCLLSIKLIPINNNISKIKIKIFFIKHSSVIILKFNYSKITHFIFSLTFNFKDFTGPLE